MLSFHYIFTSFLPLSLSLLSYLTTAQTVPRFETYSLGTVSNFRLIRPCILCCFDSDGCESSATDLPDAVGCPVAYQAYCSVYLSNVGITTDGGAGGGVTGGGGRGGDQIATKTVAAGTTTVTVGQVTSFVTRVSTVRDPTAESGTSQGKGSTSGGLDTTAQISLGVGLGVGIPALGLLVYITYLLLKQREREVQEKNGNMAFRPGGIVEEVAKHI
ncbi:hypothetical protein TWF706_008787 [Orbilia oligospora]|uniref:Apple domain-containing protein n=1 Tax=Orbilia oligospora TaxID=2813651 RepID=A0A7C8NN08_ORBOL|nr:hypothetical protein TWF706_008787 [Orbilia oligospora]KAF3140626.1 hypothetical protein TWF703_002831 [Orbilia oligospora]